MKKGIKKALSLCLILAMVFSLSACGAAPVTSSEASAVQPSSTASPSEATPVPEAAKEKLVIGVSMKTLQAEFPKNIADQIQLVAKEYGNIDIILTDGQGDVATQLSQVENLVAQKVDAIILNPQDSKGLSPAIDLCNKNNIPVIECNTLTDNENYACYVGSSDLDAGVIQGEFVKKALGEKGEVAIMYGNIGQSGQIFRKEGVEKSLLTPCPEIKLVADQTANWERDKALQLAEDWILRFPNLKAILCQNDDMAMGALQAVEKAGKAKDIIVVGIDAIPDAVQAVSEGRMACTVFQDAKNQGKGALDMAIKVANGETVEKELLIPFQLVTKDNVADFMG